MQKIIRYGIGLAFLAFAATANVALAQSGSGGGSIGNDEKSLSGSRSVEPERPAQRSKPEEEPRRSTSRRSGGGGGGGGAGNFDGAWVVVSVGTTRAGSPALSATTTVSPSSVRGMFPAAAAPERSSDRTDVSGAGLRRNNSITFCCAFRQTQLDTRQNSEKIASPNYAQSSPELRPIATQVFAHIRRSLCCVA